MGLKAFLQTLDGVDENVSGFYREGEGGYVLDVEEYTGDGINLGLTNTAGLKSALDKERKANREKEAKLNELNGFSELGLSISEIEQLKTVKESANADLESLRTQLEEKYKTDLQAQLEEKDALYNQLLSANHKNAVSSILAKDSADVVDNEGVRDFLMQNLLSQTKVDSNGNAYVVNQDGTPRLSNKAGSAENMSVSELWSAMKADPKYSFAIKASGASGSGGTGSSSTGSANLAPQTAAEFNKLSTQDRIKFYQTNPTLAKKLATEGARLK